MGSDDIRHTPPTPGAGAGAAGRERSLERFRRHVQWSLAGTFALFVALFVEDWITHPDLPAWGRAVAAAAMLVLSAAMVVLLGRRLPPAGAAVRPPVAWLAAGAAAAAVLGAVPLTLPGQRLWSLAPAVMVSLTAMFLPPERRRVLIPAAIVAAAVIGGTAGGLTGDGWRFATAFPAAMVAVTAWMMLGTLWAWDLADRLNQARGMAAELAVKDERLRFAADLHDIQGHHLQVIALKSELAARLAGADPRQAAAEMTEVHQLAVGALRDTRAVVQGYRRTTLEEELANAAKVLTAAGIDTRVEPDAGAGGGAGALPDACRHLLGLVMREATTNILRHSRARHATIGYRAADGSARLRVRNDGAAGASGPGAGTGLRALTDRLERAGGTLSWEHDDEWFELTGSLPLPAEAGIR
ncbi:histidine kinase [Actinomadura sp. 7K507]|uniref:sensor histidine kinase n=1 Tax=Actinomadura sp. 7K507 TaxID=2530365 RepID=UPI00104E1D91|nr:histidine kinase [Actinomadura sp. 7K507]TDC98413.1 histidine kinase [Actinomadura sp. 7K507]